MKKKEKECCVCINVFTKCDKDGHDKKEEECRVYDKKEECKDSDKREEECCVCINVFTECDKDGHDKKEEIPCKDDSKKKE